METERPADFLQFGEIEVAELLFVAVYEAEGKTLRPIPFHHKPNSARIGSEQFDLGDRVGLILCRIKWWDVLGEFGWHQVVGVVNRRRSPPR